MSELRKMGVRLTAEGVNQYKDDLRSAGREARLMSQETKLAMLELGDGASSADKFQTKLKGLEREYDVQKNKLKTLTTAQKEYTTSLDLVEREIKDTSSAFKASQAETNRLEKEYKELGKTVGYNAQETKKAKQAWQESKQETKELATNLNNLEKEQGQYNKELEKMPSKVNAAKISMGQLSEEMQQLNRDYIMNGGHLADASQKLTDAGGKIKTFSSGMQSVGSTLTTSVTLPIVALGTAALTTGIQFEQQMSRVGAVAGATGDQLAAMTEQAKELGASTAFSAGEVAQGMENMASAGFVVTEIMAAMPGVLDLAAVSGGDVALASEAAATAINAFGLEAGDTGHIANVFARAAADTNAEVADMAEAMKYAAPMANTLGLSIEDTAAAIGIMSDAGIKGSQAGTTLRGAFTRLAKPTKAAREAMEALGFSAFDANGNIKPMSQIVSNLQGSLMGMTKEQKASTMATIFGQEAMSGMMALIEAGGGKVDTLSRSFEDSAGAAEEMATAMQDNVAGTIDEMMGSLETAGIELTEALAPAITEIAEKVTELVGSFNELDDETQQQIIQWLALAAAAGPVLSVIGSMGQGVGTLMQMGGGLVKVIGGTQAAMNTSIPIFNTAGEAIGVMGTSAKNASGVQGVGGLIGALSKLGPVGWSIVGAGGLLAAGYGAWKLFGEEAYNAGERTKQWGTDVGQTVDGHLDKMQQLTQSTSGQFNNLASGLTTNKEQMSGDFVELGQTIESSLNERITALDELMANLPETVRSTLTELLSEDKKQAQESLKVVEDNNKRIQEIRERASKNNRDLTVAESKMILDINKESAAAYVDTLQISQQERNNILTAMTGDVESATKEQASTWAKSLAEQRQDMKLHYNEQKTAYTDALKELGYSDEAIEEHAKAWDKANEATTNGIDQQLATIAAKYPEIAKEIAFSNGQTISSMGEAGQQQIAENEKIIQRAGALSKQLAKNAEENAELISWVSEEGALGAETWNNIVLDEKTGKVKTNVREEIIKAGEDSVTWNEMRFQLHNADLSSNAKSIIGESAIVNGWWEGMAWEDKAVILNDEFSKTTYKALEESGKWNEMSIEQKTAIMYSNTPEKMTETLAYLGLWEEFEPEIKEVNADNRGFIESIMGSEEKMNYWRNIPDETKELFGDNYDLLTKIFESEESLNNFKSLPDEEKQFLGENTDLMNAVFGSQEAYNAWTSMPDNEKKMLGSNVDLMTKVFSSKEAYAEWQNMPDTLKQMTATSTVPEVAGLSRLALDQVPEVKTSSIVAKTNSESVRPTVASWNDEMNKVIKEKSSSVNANTNAGLGPTASVKDWNQTQKNTKNTNTYATTGTNAPTPTNQVNKWNQAQSGTYSTNTYATTGTNAGNPTSQVNAWNQAQKGTRSTNTRAQTSTNARNNTGSVNNWNNEVRNAPKKKTSVFETIRRTVTEFFNRGTGDPNFPGGNVWLGDAGKREPYLTPDGNFGVSGNDWEAHNLPKGTRIWPSRQSFKTSARYDDSLKQYMDLIPKFAKGGTIQNPYDGYTGLVGEAGPEIFRIAQGKVSITPITQSQRTQVLSGSSGNADMSETNSLLQALIQLVAQGQVIQMDGKEVGRSIFDEVDSTMNRNYKRSSIMSMKGGG